MPTSTARPTAYEVRAGVVNSPGAAIDPDVGTAAELEFGLAGTVGGFELDGLPPSAINPENRTAASFTVWGRWRTANTEHSLAVYFRANAANPWLLIDRQTVPDTWPNNPDPPAPRTFDVLDLVGNEPRENWQILLVPEAAPFAGGGDPPFPEG